MEASELAERIVKAGKTKGLEMDWIGMEMLLVDILRSDLLDQVKVSFCKQAVDAYTKRGHFPGER